MNDVIKIADYTYHLPESRIAVHPLKERDQSRLLIFKEGQIRHETFHNISNYLPAESVLFFNDTKVVPARLLFTKHTGAQIEVFILEPKWPSPDIQLAMAATRHCQWKCAIGNLKKWSEDVPLTISLPGIELVAQLINRSEGEVAFSWSPEELPFSHVIQQLGKTPLPPYLKRDADPDDLQRYQTIYAVHEGAVAAPTAGLHFTPSVLDQVAKKGIEQQYLTLHVGAGTFQPVKSENALEHPMHEEQVVVTRSNLQSLLQDKLVVPVGTTSMRVLESLYWYGVKLHDNPGEAFTIRQHDPYLLHTHLSAKESIELLLRKMDREGADALMGRTSIYIHPGYSPKICHALVTNFHQPSSTLILLVAALIGDSWRKVYDEALANEYRFLSYGDSSLLFFRDR